MNLMTIVSAPIALFSVVVMVFILVEGFETLVLPRRIERPLRMVTAFYKTFWSIWRTLARLAPPAHQDNVLSIFGPLSLLMLLSIWALGLIVSFATLEWSLGSPITAPEGTPTYGTYLYLSATTFVTLGFGDVTPSNNFARLMADIEGGVGFGFLALVIGYFPVLYGAFSRREVEIALLDARASSPPSAGALLQRVGVHPENTDLLEMLGRYERWAAELMESHLSYPILMYYRSQHDRQSWLSALTTILDACAILIAAGPNSKITWQARMTFAMSRHAAVDLAHVFNIPPEAPKPDRLPPERWVELRASLVAAGVELHDGPAVEARLSELRYLYEPFINTLARALELAIPSWLPNPNLPDNWQTSAWDHRDHFFQTAAEVSHEMHRPGGGQ